MVYECMYADGDSQLVSELGNENLTLVFLLSSCQFLERDSYTIELKTIHF